MSTMLAAVRPKKKPLSRPVVHHRRRRRQPPLGQMKTAGFTSRTSYGLTKSMDRRSSTTGKRLRDSLPDDEQASLKSRQGVRYRAGIARRARSRRDDAARAGRRETMGSRMFRGNVVMKGYLKRTRRRIPRGVRGRLVPQRRPRRKYPDGYAVEGSLEDIIISGGENISSIEVEDALFKHPAVAQAAVVAKPDVTDGRDALRLCRAGSPGTRARRKKS